VLPFGLSVRYFFFAAFLAVFFAAFLAGFLAAFLVAICLFSLFDGLHRVLQIKLQLKNV
jgi:predicted PurR-regulated permease PerM